MSLSICTSCLARLRLIPTASSIPSISQLPSSISSFHTSAIQQNVVKKKTTVAAGAKPIKLRESRSARIKKKDKERPRPPPVGQRKAERKRIVLSNTNALPVNGLEALSKDNMADAAKVGQMLSLDGPLLDQLREAKAFKVTQNWGLFRTPSVLARGEAVDLGADVQDVVDEKGTVRKLIVGEKASGKSVHLLHAMSLGYMNKFVVVNVPDCQEYVNNQSAYVPISMKEGDKEQMYNQPQLARDLLTRVAYSNPEVLEKLKPVHNHSKLTPPRKQIKSLKDLAMVGAEDVNVATQVWNAFWKEMQEPSRPPMVVTIDGINFWMGPTKYRDADFKIVHSHQFTLIQHFLNLVFPKTENALPNGGIILACTTKSNHPTTPAFDHLVRQIRARNAGITVTDPAFPLHDPYMKLADQRVSDLMQRIEHTRLTELKGLSRGESKGLLEYFARSGILREQVTDGQVAEKWSLSGGGIVGELCKLGSRTRVGMFETGRREGVRIRV